MDFAVHYSARAKPEGIMNLKGFLDAYCKRCCLLLLVKNREWEQIPRHQMKVRQSL
jgi:glycerophosphoryl diester phosphodiesterase